jgi:hypothetical protein
MIECMRGVLKVKNIIADPGDFIERTRIKIELSEKLFKILEEK